VQTIIIKNPKLATSLSVDCEDETVEMIAKVIELACASNYFVLKLAQFSQTQNARVSFTANDKGIPLQGLWIPKQSMIWINHMLPLDKLVQTLVFELCNATNDELTSEKIHFCNFNNGKGYANFIEKAEHQSFLESCRIYLELISKYPTLLTPSQKDLQDFQQLADETSYLEFVKQNGHYQFYINAYEQWAKKNHPLKSMAFFTKSETPIQDLGHIITYYRNR
jgi:hypothetical protein